MLDTLIGAITGFLIALSFGVWIIQKKYVPFVISCLILVLWITVRAVA